MSASPATSRPDRSPRARTDGRRGQTPAFSLAAAVARFGLGIRRFARQRITLADAERAIRRSVETRAARFLDLVDRAVFAQPRSPYRALFRCAGLKRGDVHAVVHGEGVDAALRRLYESGVYVSHEEFKGTVPAVRGGREMVFRDQDFDNPLVTPHLPGHTGGSSWRPSRIVIDLELIAQMAPHWAVWFAEHDLFGQPLVFVNPSYPAAVTHQLMCARFGIRFAKWFSTGDGGSATYRAVTRVVHALARSAAGFPRPQSVDAGDLTPVAEYLAGLTGRAARPAVNTSPGMAVRTSLAARARGLSLTGVTFLLGAEPLTVARRASIEESGARATVTYGFSEGGNVGSQCARGGRSDDIHVSLDAFAVAQRARPLPDGSVVDSLLLTSLRTATPKVLLNTEIGDHAVLETRRCGCRFDGYGYTQHLHTIRSFGKLTGDGVTFIGADILHVLEAALPRRFGGSPADHQLVEEQAGDGRPRYRLLVSPDVGPVDERAVAAAFLENLGRLRRPYGFMVNQWVRTGALEVARLRPQPGVHGKLAPFRTLDRP